MQLEIVNEKVDDSHTYKGPRKLDNSNVKVSKQPSKNLEHVYRPLYPFKIT